MADNKNPKVEALCLALAENFQMEADQLAPFKVILVQELIKSGFLDAKGNVVVAKTTTVAPAVATGGAPSAVTESYQQFMSRRNTELKPTVPDWKQRSGMIKAEWEANKGKKPTASKAPAVAGAAGDKPKRKKTNYQAFTGHMMADPKMIEQYKSGKDRMRAIAALWKNLGDAEKAEWKVTAEGGEAPAVAPQAAPVPAEKEAEAEEDEEAEGEDA